jgi:hypothetical protein
MKSSLKRRNLKLETRPCYLTPSSNFRGKFHTRWLGPYEIDIVYENGAIKLHTIDEERTPLMENGHRLRLYHRPLSKESFLKRITSGWPDNDLEIVNKGGTLLNDSFL